MATQDDDAPRKGENPEEIWPRLEFRRPTYDRIWPDPEELPPLEDKEDVDEFVSPLTSYPLLMLPVGIETRIEGVGASRTLRIRIMPDQLHVIKDDDGLTKAEEAAAARFWATYQRGKDGKQRQNLTALIQVVGARRVGHVIDATAPYASDHTIDEIKQDTPPRPYLTALPYRWIAVGYTERGFGFLRKGRTINGAAAGKLEVGATGFADQMKDTFNGIPVSAGNRWMVDYNDALDRGMAIDVPLTGRLNNAGRLTSLVVFGVTNTSDPKLAQTVMERLFESHERNEGIAFLEQGVPTNNTAGAQTPWAYSDRDVDHLLAHIAKQSEDAEKRRASADEASTNRTIFTRALGLTDIPALQRAAQGASTERDLARAMNTVLFEPTVGNFARNLLPPKDVDHVDLTKLREWFVSNVTGGAPLPTLRIGNAPYGLLPVTPLPRSIYSLDRAETLDTFIKNCIVRVRDVWLEGLENVPLLDPNAVDQSNNPTDPRTDIDAIPSVLASAPHPARFFSRKVTDGADETVPAYNSLVSQITRADVIMLEIVKNRSRAFNRAKDIDAQLVVWAMIRLDVNNRRGVTAEWKKLQTKNVDAVLAALGKVEQRQRPLKDLELPLFQGAIGPEMSRLLTTGSDKATKSLEYLELVEPKDLSARLLQLSKSAREGVGVKQAYASKDVFTHLVFHSLAQLPPDHAVEVADALELLAKNATADQILRMVRETLGVASHRLDAWYTSLASQRLANLRAAPGYETGVFLGGYGFLNDLDLTPKPRQSSGFIHAPSVPSAATAAVVRSGWLAHGGEEKGSLAAVDAGSARVRLAHQMLDGIRNGQSVGSLLGYRFERDLREGPVPAPHLIRDIRLAVMEAQKRTGNADSPVDGKALLDLVRNGALSKSEALEDAGVQSALGRMEAVFDAVHDIALFEGTHSATQGQSEHARAVFEAVNQGTQLPPEFRAQRTTVDGTTIDHRVMIALPAVGDQPQQASGWHSGLRDQLTPDLERWVRGLLPAADEVGFMLGTTVLTLAALELSALDFVFLADDNPSELSGPLRALAAKSLSTSFEKTLALPADVARSNTRLNLEEVQLLAGEIRSMFDVAVPLAATHLSPRGQAGSEDQISAIDHEELLDLRSKFSTALDSDDIMALARFGLVDPQPQQVLVNGTQRLEQVENAVTHGTAGDVAALLFGRRIPILTPFQPPKNSAKAFDVTFDSDLATPDEAAQWLEQMGRLRPNIGALTTADFLASLMGQPALTLQVGQDIRPNKEKWVAMHPPSTDTKGRLSVLAVTTAEEEVFSDRIVGFMLDQWSETVPSRDQMTGAAFHYDAPSTRPPQSLLLTTMPRDITDMHMRDVAHVLFDTLQFAAIRMVQPEDLADFGSVLPTLFTAPLPDQEGNTR